MNVCTTLKDILMNSFQMKANRRRHIFMTITTAVKNKLEYRLSEVE